MAKETAKAMTTRSRSSTTRADVVDAGRLDHGIIDRGLLVGLSRVDEIGKEIGPVREKLALEPLVQEPEQHLRRMKPVGFCPIAEVARPLAAEASHSSWRRCSQPVSSSGLSRLKHHAAVCSSNFSQAHSTMTTAPPLVNVLVMRSITSAGSAT